MNKIFREKGCRSEKNERNGKNNRFLKPTKETNDWFEQFSKKRAFLLNERFY